MEHYIYNQMFRQLSNVPMTESSKKIVTNEYFKSSSNQKEVLVSQIIDFFTDVYFLAPLENMMDKMVAVGTDVHYYVNEFHSYDIFGNTLLNRTTAAHGSDLLYLFGPTMYKKFFNTDFQSVIR